MSSEDDISKGVAEGFLNWSEAKVKDLVKKFKDRKLAFIKEEETIEEVKESKKNSEYKLFIKYVEDKDLRIIFRMGLSLRKIEKDSEKTLNLKEKIKKKYKNQGLHFAYFVQNKLFTKYYASLVERFSEDTIKDELNFFTKETDKCISFISNQDELSQKLLEITTKINANSPETFIISSWGGGANKICKKVFNKVDEALSNRYIHTDFSEKDKIMYMLIRTN